MKKFILIIIILVVGIVVFFGYQNRTAVAPTVSPQANVKITATPILQVSNSIYDPARITKKPFGIYITSQNSPVQPEKFTGYHTGVDFETTTAEANIDISVPAFCDGKLLLKEYASGYGGVAVESCVLNSQTVTVIYGHLKLASIMPAIGQTLKKGDLLGVLGKGYSTETDGERKHLHLGIHLGPTINILGYVQSQSALFAWLDPAQFLK